MPWREARAVPRCREGGCSPLPPWRDNPCLRRGNSWDWIFQVPNGWTKSSIFALIYTCFLPEKSLHSFKLCVVRVEYQ